MAKSYFPVVVALGALSASCDLSVSGLGDSPTLPGADASFDAHVALPDASNGSDASDVPDASDGMIAIDSAVDAPIDDADAGMTDAEMFEAGTDADASPPPDACALTSPVAVGDKMVGATLAPSKAVTVDGNLADWAGVTFTPLDSTTAAMIYYGACAPPQISAKFALRYDASTIYFAIQVTDVNVDGTSSSTFNNDSVELYLGGVAPSTGDYTATDNQIVIDFQNHAQNFRDSAGGAPPATFASATSIVSGGYIIEAKLGGAALGIMTFSAGMQLPFDVAINDAPNQIASLIWDTASSSACTCTSCCCHAASPVDDRPFCDRLRWGKVTLN